MNVMQAAMRSRKTPGQSSLLDAIPGSVLALILAFSTNLEGSVIEMKPAAPVPVDTAASLKA